MPRIARNVLLKLGNIPAAGEERALAQGVFDHKSMGIQPLKVELMVHSRFHRRSVTHDGCLHTLCARRPNSSQQCPRHNESVSGGACLAHVPHLRRVGALHGGGDIRVLKDDERCVAARFHRGAERSARPARAGSGPPRWRPVNAFRGAHQPSARRQPHRYGEVVTTFSTPSGRPPHASGTQYRELGGVREAGLSTAVQPAASAGATLRAAMASGKFQG